MDQPAHVRTAAKAVIRRDGRLLVNHYRDAEGDWYALPGGGQQVGEALVDTLTRECEEEIGCRVRVVGLRWVRDYVAAHHAFSYLEEAAHQVEHLFECEVPPDYTPRLGAGPDRGQIGVTWLGAATLGTARIYPSRLRGALDPGLASAWPVYWGDEN